MLRRRDGRLQDPRQGLEEPGRIVVVVDAGAGARFEILLNQFVV